MSLPMKWCSSVAVSGLPVAVEVEPALRGQRREAADVADRRIEPDVEVLAGRIRDLEAEVGRVARDVPVLQAGVEPFIELGAHRRLQAAGRASHSRSIGFEVAERKNRCSESRSTGLRAGDRRDRVLEVGRRIGRAADSRSCRRTGPGVPAARAGAAHEAVRQEHAGLLVVGLAHRRAGDGAARAQRLRTARASGAGSPRCAWSGNGRSAIRNPA